MDRLTFSIHPRELEIRRKRCRPVIGSFARAPRAAHTCCNICGCTRTAFLANRDRYDFSVRTVLCLGCGLIYLVDRLASEGYSKFYGDGIYRSLTTQFSGHQPGIDVIGRDQVRYAARVIDSLEGFCEPSAPRTLLDIGGSAGLVAASVASRFGCAATVLDPAVDEIAAAKIAGLNGVVGSLETYQTEEKFDIILLCRSIEHMFDLRYSILKIRDLLNPHGLFYCDIVDFVESCRLFGGPETVTKIDHCYWLCQETAPIIFETLGFEVISADVTSQSDTIGYLLRPCQATVEPRMTSEMAINVMVRQLREINSDWRRYGDLPNGFRDKLRRIAYRMKRDVVRGLSSKRFSPFEQPFEEPNRPSSPRSACPDTSATNLHYGIHRTNL
jgi:SAM-dependent methyltransferase